MIAVGGAAGRALFDDANEIVGRDSGRVRSCPSRSTSPPKPASSSSRLVTGDDQVDLRHAQRRVWSEADRLGRDARGIGDADGRRRSHFRQTHCSSQNAADLVARRGLPGDTPADVLPGPVGEFRLAQIRHVQPLGRVAGILVVEHVRDRLRAALRARVDEVPDAILLDRPAEGAVEVVDLA